MRLNEYFSGVAAKLLRPVETDASVSNQHEFNGINRFRQFLGDDRQNFNTTFLYLDDEELPVRSSGQTTWYDSREADPSRSAEFRLYFPSNDVSACYSPGDLLIVAMRPDGTLLTIATPNQSSVGSQLLWLFNIEHPVDGYLIREAEEIDRDVDYVVRWILDAIGIELVVDSVDSDIVSERFGRSLPTTRIFSAFAREHVTACDPRDDPDHALIAWLETEERFFRAFERLLVEERLRDGFLQPDNRVDVDGFIDFSLSVQNRRKSRAGLGLENHMEFILEVHGLRFNRGATTEGRSKPDFLFPGTLEYSDPLFDDRGLSILGSKTSCKDRWRQILGEADRVDVKHLLTVEPSISENQTQEMQTRNVQLVLPEAIHSTYNTPQQNWLWNVEQFLKHIQDQQS